MKAEAYDPIKMQAAIVFFCDRIRNGTLGRTKLAKLLYFLDFDHFEQFDSPVTGAEYVHYSKGPYPKQMLQELRQMSGTVKEVQEQVGPYVQYAYSLQPGVMPDFRGFKPSELSVMLQVADKWEKQTATELVAATHGEAPWIATADGENIPYAYAYYRRKFEAAPDSEEETSPLISIG